MRKVKVFIILNLDNFIEKLVGNGLKLDKYECIMKK